MLTLLSIVHVLIGLALVLFVLLQDPKGGAMGAFTGGSSATSFFGASGASNFLSTTTRWLAVAFAASCLTLTYVTSSKGGSVMDNYVAPPAAPGSSTPAAPAEGSAPATPEAGKTQPSEPEKK